MSELKAILATPHPKMKNACDGAIEVYPKSEADKVIAELKKERDWLAKDRAQAYDDLEKRAQLNIQKDKEIARLKEDALNTDKAREKWLQLARKQAKEICRLKRALYKACAMWAKSEIRRRFGGYPHEGNGWFKMKTKCLKLAEKFKEAK